TTGDRERGGHRVNGRIAVGVDRGAHDGRRRRTCRWIAQTVERAVDLRERDLRGVDRSDQWDGDRELVREHESQGDADTVRIARRTDLDASRGADLLPESLHGQPAEVARR